MYHKIRLINKILEYRVDGDSFTKNIILIYYTNINIYILYISVIVDVL